MIAATDINITMIGHSKLKDIDLENIFQKEYFQDQYL